MHTHSVLMYANQDKYAGTYAFHRLWQQTAMLWISAYSDGISKLPFGTADRNTGVGGIPRSHLVYESWETGSANPVPFPTPEQAVARQPVTVQQLVCRNLLHAHS